MSTPSQSVDNIQERLEDIDRRVYLIKKHERSMIIGNLDTFLAVYGYHNVTIMLLVMGWWSDSELIGGQIWLSCDEILSLVVLNMVSADKLLSESNRGISRTSEIPPRSSGRAVV